MYLMLFKRSNWLKCKLICFPCKPRAKQRKEMMRVMLVGCEAWRWGLNWEWTFLEKIFQIGQTCMDCVTSFSWRRSTEHHAHLRCLPLGERISLFLEWLCNWKSFPPFGTYLMVSCNVSILRNVLSLHYNNYLFMCLTYLGSVHSGCLGQFIIVPPFTL